LFTWFEKLVSPYPDTEPKHFPKKLGAFLWVCTEGLRPFILFTFLLVAMLGIFEAMLFSMLGNVIDWLSQTTPTQLWTERKGSLLLLTAILLASPLLVMLQAQLKYQTLSSNFPMRLRWNFHRYMLSQSIVFYQHEFAGRVATKVMQTPLAVRDTVLIVVDILVFVIIFFATMLLLIGHFEPWLLLPFLVWLGCYLAALYYFVPRLGKVATRQADARSLMTGRITDAYTNIATVKLFSHAQHEAHFTQKAMKEFLAVAYAQMRLISGFELVNHCLSILLIMATTGMTIWFWMQGQLGIGAVAAATAMALRLNSFSHWIMWEMASLFENIGTVQDGINTLSRPQAVKDQPDAKLLEVSQGDIKFEHVSFSYGTGKPIINDFSLHIRPGEKIGLVGRSGAGKSTIVNLLLRLYNIEQGQILIDGQNILEVSQDSLRAQIGMVTQDTSLLHRSVRDNLLYGRPWASDEEIVAAARGAEADAFIQQLSDTQGRTAYKAHVGERGVRLSGGQRQRIAIARVMLKDAPILILDEATSALDSEVEAAIQTSLYKLMQGKTVLAIAHRLSTIAAMDRLIVLDKGHIVEEGTHQALLAQQGIYAKLWMHQSGGFLGEHDD
jgi:ATP-binding cassette subfamily B multidrug efflux pump